MNRNEYGRSVSSWFEYAATCLQRVSRFELERAVWEVFGGMSVEQLDSYDDAELRASIRGRLLALDTWKARHGMTTATLPAIREGWDD